MAESINCTQNRLALRNKNFLSHAVPEKPSDFGISLRKQKRKEHFCKKRSQNVPAGPILLNCEAFIKIKEIIQCGSSDAKFKEALIFLRNLYARQDKTLSWKLTKSLNLVEDLLSLLKSFRTDQDEFKLVLNCMCNLSSGPVYITEELFSLGLDEVCFELLNDSQSDVWVEAVWCLSNLTVDSLSFREKLIKRGVLEIYIEKLHEKQDTLLWAIRNLVEGVKDIEKRVLEKLLGGIKEILNGTRSDFLVEALWIFSILSDGNAGQVDYLIMDDVFKVFINTLRSDSSKVLKPVLRAIGNIAAGTSKQAQVLLDNDILQLIYAVFNRSKDFQVRKYGLWIVTNLTSGTRLQIDTVVSHPIIVTAVTCINNCDNNIRKEAISISYNISKLGNTESIKNLVNVGIFKEFKEFLSDSLDSDLILTVLETTYQVLSAFKSGICSEVFSLFITTGMVEIINRTSYSKSPRIEGASLKILRLIEKNEFDKS